MKDKQNEETSNQSEIISGLITKVIVDFCMKSENPVDLTQIVKALSDVLAAHLATMTNGWSEAETEKCVNVIFNHIVSTMKECKNGIEESNTAN